MDQIGQDQTGAAGRCGRTTAATASATASYGTTMALMLLPFWTDGCIGSMEGLYFEASGTTPYHFLTAAAMSTQSSNPVRQLRYVNNDADVGVEYLQALGVRYVMVHDRRGDRAGRRPARADLDRRERAVAHLPGRRLRRRGAARRAAGGRQRPRRRPARALPGARHVVVPEPGRVGGDARRRRPRRLAAHRRRHRREPGGTDPRVRRARSTTGDRRSRRRHRGRGDIVRRCRRSSPVALDPVEVTNVEIERAVAVSSTSSGRACRCS